MCERVELRAGGPTLTRAVQLYPNFHVRLFYAILFKHRFLRLPSLIQYIITLLHDGGLEKIDKVDPKVFRFQDAVLKESSKVHRCCSVETNPFHSSIAD